MTDEVGNEEISKHATLRDSSEPISLVITYKHAKSPTSQPKLQLAAAANEEVGLQCNILMFTSLTYEFVHLILPHTHALPLLAMKCQMLASSLRSLNTFSYAV